jgi:hypothetical protein
LTGDERLNRLVGVIEKLDEARFFLDHIRKAGAGGTNNYVSAFAAACYSVWECLEAVCRPEPKRVESCPTCHRSRPVEPMSDSPE